jgi:hypothetical protein
MSPSGVESFSKVASAITARRTAAASSGDRPRINYFQISDGDVARVRFLEQGEDLTWAQTHRIRNQWGYYKNVPCMDQMDEGTSCLLCQSDSEEIRKRNTRGFVNLIWRGTEDEGITRAPIYKRNEKGGLEKDQMKQKIITGFEDSVWMWECSKAVFELIVECDASYKGLMSRDFLVKRKGADKSNTSYNIVPAVIDGGAEPVSVLDATLSQQKADVKIVSTPDSDEIFSLLQAQNAPGGRSPNISSPNIGSSQEDILGSGPIRSSAFSK